MKLPLLTLLKINKFRSRVCACNKSHRTTAVNTIAIFILPYSILRAQSQRSYNVFDFESSPILSI